MIFLDANIIIYAFKADQQGALLRTLLKAHEEELACSDMIRLEVLGFAHTSSSERRNLKKFFAQLTCVPIHSEIIDVAVRLRQQKNIKSPDAVIAATAIQSGSVLWTANTRDFAKIEGLTFYNPLAEEIQG